MKVKSTIRYHLTLVRTVTIKKTGKAKGSPHALACWWASKLVFSVLENSIEEAQDNEENLKIL